MRSDASALPPAAGPGPAEDGPRLIKIAILAMGGEGGGVLADWLVSLAEAHGHLAQTTSVPGVAQRTGATIYYVEMFPAAAAQQAGRAPVMALMPMPGDVDIVLASELMEAGRAVQRGLVTLGRTTLLTSTHRVYAIAEKTSMGDGRADSAALLALARGAARRFVGFDMAQAAEDAGSVISAVLFGALAATGELPFTRAQFEATIERGGVGVAASLRAFAAAYERAGQAAAGPAAAAAVASADATPLPTLPRAADPAVQALLERAVQAHGADADTWRLVLEGLRRTVDYQDPAYGALYLDRLDAVRAAARAAEPAFAATLVREAARHLALWMSWEDTIRVADLKTRDSRFARVRGEVRAGAEQVLAIQEYLHPRLQEIAETMPAPLGRWLLASGAPRRWVERLAARGRVVETSSLRGYLMLAAVAALRRWRRSTLRYALENARIEDWLAELCAVAPADAALAVEIARCQRLVKGYGDTHARGWRNFETLRATWRGPARPAPALLAELREAALADEHGRALQAALRRHGLAA
jgi:indolepyruvate ferredoxin oxidoreductase beta subunit